MSLTRYVLKDKKTRMYLKRGESRLGAEWTEELDQSLIYETASALEHDRAKFTFSRRFDLVPVPVRVDVNLYSD